MTPLSFYNKSVNDKKGYRMVDNEEIANLCSKYKIEVQNWLKLAIEVMDTQEMQVA